MAHTNESWQQQIERMQMSHVTRKRVVKYVNESCRV